jgi:undecaprenyl-diphosphatase
MIESLILLTKEFIISQGYWAVFLLTTTEQFIFPIPADIFITTATSHGLIFSKVLLIVLAASLIGSVIGYFLGKWLGHPIAVWLFKEKNVNKAEAFISKWGLLGVIVAGISPIPFKLVTWMAGIFEMPFGRYMLGVIIGRMPRYILTAGIGSYIYTSKWDVKSSLGAAFLGMLQGITEFLPISSSGHLVIAEHFMKLPLHASELLTFDIFLHGGSLLAIVIYFYKDFWQIIQEVGRMIFKGWLPKGALSLNLALGTLPAIFGALIFGGFIETNLRALPSIAIAFLLIGVFYFFVAWKGRKNNDETLTARKAVLMGLAQTLALIPGVSRSGITIGTGVWMGLTRKAAARFSFLLGGIAILAANIYNLLSINADSVLPDMQFILTGTITSFAFSLASIAFLIKFLEKYTLRTFAVYLILAGITILSFF